jgi:hypothetical protein
MTTTILQFFLGGGGQYIRTVIPNKISIFEIVLRIRETGPGAFFTPGSGIGKNPDPVSGIRDEHTGSFEN